jgi:hypothetical protein
MAAPTLKRIVTGGQTGVDRGALDAALDRGFPCGGWCPAGRLAEDGRIPGRYPVVELPGGTYRDRTLQNTTDSDGTVLIYRGTLDGGTRATLELCLAAGKPFKLLDAEQARTVRMAVLLAKFVKLHGIATLNVAGPRESEWPDGQLLAYGVVTGLLNRCAR